MNNQSETLTGGIHHILYGSRKPVSVLERYEQNQADGELYHLLTSFPASPADYIELHETLRTRWNLYLKDKAEMSRKWLSPFYNLPAEQFSAFHILCDFYSFFIRAECRMMIQVSEARKEDLAISTLKFETLTLRNELLELIRDTSNRMQRDQPDTLKGDLNQFVLERLQNNLLITFLELQIRSAHLLENRVISKRDLFLKYLNQPEPKVLSWHRTATLTRFELEGALRTPEKAIQLRSIEDLLTKVRSESPDHKSKIQDSINLLENVWLCLFMMNDLEIWSTVEVTNPEECAERINDIHHQLYQISASDKRSDIEKIIQIIIQQFDRIQSLLSSESEGETSSAMQLISSVKSHYEGNSEDGPSVKQTGSNASMVVREAPSSAVLDQFIPVDQLQEKLNVSLKSMNKYISTSKTPIHKFSNKTRLIHVNDFNTMMEHFKTTL